MSRRPRLKKYKTALTTFSIALGIGFIMQYGDAMASRWGEDQPVGGPSLNEDIVNLTPVTASLAVPTTLLIPEPATTEHQETASAIIPTEPETPMFASLANPSVDALPEMVEEPSIELAAVNAPDLMIDEMPGPIATELGCEETLTATPSGFAMVTLDYVAPCNAEMAVTIVHEDMIFEMQTDAKGMLTIDVPALSEEALFGVEANEGEAVFTIVAVPEIAMYDRVALQWQGRSDVQLHALEFGATYGDTGHVWAASAGDRINAATGEGGFLTRLGSGTATNGFFADVYTFPTGLSAMDGRIALSVEAEVTAMNCGRSVQAQTMQVTANARPTTQSLSMTMPDCDAIGEFLVLNNMYEDLTLASK